MSGTSRSNHMDTSQKINHVFGCQGTTLHITPGFKLLASGDASKCPQCGAETFDATNTPVGQAYIAFGRIDLGDLPS